MPIVFAPGEYTEARDAALAVDIAPGDVPDAETMARWARWLDEAEKLEAEVIDAWIVDIRPQLRQAERAQADDLKRWIRAAGTMAAGFRILSKRNPHTDDETAEAIDALADSGDVLVLETIDEYWGLLRSAAKQAGMSPGDLWRGDAVELERAKAIFAGDEPARAWPLRRLDSLPREDALSYRLALLAHLPAILEGWREDRSRTTYRYPAPNLVKGKGKDSFSAFFGREGITGNVKRFKGELKVTVTNRAMQGDLFIEPEAVTDDASASGIVGAINRTLTPRGARAFHAAFAAAAEDVQHGGERGLFWYTPTRIGDMLGMREGGDGRISKEHARELDDLMRGFANIGVRFEAMHNGQLATFDAPYIVGTEGTARLGSPGHPGRRKRTLMRINVAFWGLVDGDAPYFVDLPRAALKPPPDVSQTSWDVCHLVFGQLAGHARVNAKQAKKNARLPWSRKLDDLIAESRSAPPSMSKTAKRRWMRARLEELAEHPAGLFSFRITGEGADQKVLFTLPHVRAALSGVPEAKKVTGRKGKGTAKKGAR